MTSIDHVGVAVADLAGAIAFYESTLGLRLTHTEVNRSSGITEAMLAGDEPGACLQLLAPTTPSSVIAKFLDRSGPGVQHVAFRVDDLEAVSGSFRTSRVRMLYEHAVAGTSGSLINFAHPKDCGGVLIELVQPAPPAPSDQ